MLTQLRVKNFRLLRDVTIDFGDLTVFIGPNSSGKSTVLEVLDLLARFATDDIQEALSAHGGFESVRTIGARTPLEIATRWEFPNVVKGGDAVWKLEWNLALEREPNGAVLVRHESLLDGDRCLVETLADGRRVVHDEVAPDPRPVPIISPRALAFDAIRDPVRYPGLHDLNLVVGELRVLGSLSASPAWARPDVASGSARDALVLAPSPFVGRQGVGLANALYNLSMDHRELWSDLERAFRAEFPFVKRIVFPPDPAGSKITFAIEDERFPERKVFASELSDGMIAYLVLLSAIIQPDHVGVLGLDEPDATIHPTALRRLLELAQREDDSRRLVVVTHSNALLDALQDAAKQVRVVEGTRNGATITTLDAPALAAWRKEYSLSELRRMGVLDRPNTAYARSDPANEAAAAEKPRRRGSKR